MKFRLLCLLFPLMFFQGFSQIVYFPPIDGPSWDSVPPQELGWNTDAIPPLYNFLERNNTKAFIVLKEGKIVLEKYFGRFSQDSVWKWASAGKTLTAALVGIAQEEGYLSISDKTSKYLGEGWTNCPKEKEDLITIRHQLTMTTGLDDEVEDPYCTKPECLKYKADAGTRWAYHNAPYTLLEKVVEKATGKNYNIYFSQKIRNKIGMNGLWVKVGYNNVYFSNARSMARFGILLLNKGVWETIRIIPEKYYNEMINTSQSLNKSYGYLFWLNGKESFMVPNFQFTFKGPLFKYAPEDLIAALGKDGQVLNVSFKHSLVIVRMGDDTSFDLTMSLSDSIWKYLNQIIVYTTNVNEETNEKDTYILTPQNSELTIEGDEGIGKELKLFNLYGECIYFKEFEYKEKVVIDLNRFPSGIYFLLLGSKIKKVIKYW
ncbi:MAG: serine hydrolase [Ignavibacteria bacterium]|nr:serine hydrolase [Ignavibacteria bacterium]